MSLSKIIHPIKNIPARPWNAFLQHPYSYAVLMAAYIGIHLHFYWLGGKFDDYDYRFWQMLDIELLRTRLLESLWYLHIQPPLFNLFLGLVEQGSFGRAKIVYPVFYHLLGVVSAIALFRLLLRFRIRAGIALFTTCGCFLSPSWMLYENWLMYTFPIMALLIFIAAKMHIYVQTQKSRDGVVLFVLMMLLAYLRSIFHYLWFLAAVGILWTYFNGKRKSLLLAACVPFFLIMALYAKNAAVFGSWTTSTWLGPNLNMMTAAIPLSIKRDYLLQGKITPISVEYPFSPVDYYQKFITHKTWGVPVLDRKEKNNGDINFNHGDFVEINRRYQKEAMTLIAASPVDYWILVKRNWRRYCHPAWNYEFFIRQSPGYKNYLLALDRWLFGWKKADFSQSTYQTKTSPQGTFLCWQLPILILFWPVLMAAPEKYSRLSAADRATLTYCMFTLLLVTFAALFFVSNENFRLRFTLTPYYALLLGLLLDRGMEYCSQRGNKEE